MISHNHVIATNRRKLCAEIEALRDELYKMDRAQTTYAQDLMDLMDRLGYPEGETIEARIIAMWKVKRGGAL